MAASRKSPSTESVRAAVADCLNRTVRPGQRLVVGLSGGVDSVVLLHALYALEPVDLTAIHVHHGLSPFADQWSEFCRNLCQRWQVPLRVEYVQVERGSGDGLEAAARRVRHEALQRAGADWVVLAHHQGDRAETMLFNVLRGAGVRGAGALREVSGRLLRPLLSVNRLTIFDYAKSVSLPWVEDPSNADIGFSRNYLRHGVLPELETRFPAATTMLARAAGHFAEAADLLDELARMDLSGRDACFPVPVDVLRGLPEPRARNLLRFLLWRSGVGIPSEERLVEALRQCCAAAPDRHPAISFGSHVLRRRARQIHLDPG
jgi:tRNA(Ile)-lysidine synthase